MAEGGVALIGTGDAAKALGIARNTLSRWAARGELRPASFTPGGHMRWDLDDLRRQIAALREKQS